MKIHVLHISDIEVEVTLMPGWLGRLFGARTRRGRIVKRGSHPFWYWKATNREAESSIRREIECTTVEDLPRLRLVKP